MVTIAAIEARLAQLRREAEQVKANLHAYDGAIQECEYWLAVALNETAGETGHARPD